MIAKALVVTAATLAVGCGADFPGPPDVALGTGVDRFVDIADGDKVPIIMGLQGGYHVWGSVRARYVDPKQVRLVFTLTHAGESAPFTIRHDTIDLAGADDGNRFGLHLGSAVFLPDLASAQGRPCRFALDLTDRAGRHVTVERSVVPTGP